MLIITGVIPPEYPVTITGTEPPGDSRPTYGEIRRRVGRFLGIGTDTTEWTDSEKSAVEDAIRSGMRWFYFPASETPYYWSFLRKSAAVTLEPAKGWYNLPTDFVSMDSVFSEQSGNIGISQINAAHIRLKVSNEGATGSPREFGVRVEGANYQVGFYPTPDNAEDIAYWYVYDPRKLNSDDDIPRGAGDHSETIISACLAAAQIELTPEGIPEGGPFHYQEFQRRLQSSMLRDQVLLAGGEA